MLKTKSKTTMANASPPWLRFECRESNWSHFVGIAVVRRRVEDEKQNGHGQRESVADRHGGELDAEEAFPPRVFVTLAQILVDVKREVDSQN